MIRFARTCWCSIHNGAGQHCVLISSLIYYSSTYQGPQAHSKYAVLCSTILYHIQELCRPCINLGWDQTLIQPASMLQPDSARDTTQSRTQTGSSSRQKQVRPPGLSYRLCSPKTLKHMGWHRMDDMAPCLGLQDRRRRARQPGQSARQFEVPRLCIS